MSLPIAPPIATAIDSCASAPGLVLDVPETISGHWNGAMTTGGTASATARWCGNGTVSLDRFVLTSERGMVATWDFDSAVTQLAHGERFSRDVDGPADPQELVLTATAHDAAGHELHASAQMRSVPDPRFVSERDACTARGGRFAPAGMMRTFACDAPTHDAGRRCLSSAECESECIHAGIEVTTSPPDHRQCAPGEEVRLHVGTCAATSLVFGCRSLLVDLTTECAVPGHLSGRRVVCVD